MTNDYKNADATLKAQVSNDYKNADATLKNQVTAAYQAADQTLVDNYKKSGTIGGWTFENGNVSVADLTGKTLTIGDASYNLTGLSGLLEIASAPDWTSAMENKDTKKFLSDSVKAFVEEGRLNGKTASVGNFLIGGTKNDKGEITAASGNNFIINGHGGDAVGTVSGINGIVISTLGNAQNGGEKTTVQNTNETVAIGNGVKVTVDPSLTNDVYNANTVIGTHASAVNSGEGVALGTDAALNNVKYGIAIGNGAKVTNDNADKDDYQGYQGIAIGSGAMVSNAKFGIAIGSNAKAEAWNSIALGRSSDTDESYTVAVGSSDQYYGKRRIIHMADGAADDNAATVGQTLHYKINATLKDDPNISGNKVADIDYGTVELAGTIDDKGNKVGTKITNLAAGTEDTDAVNVGQLKAVTKGYADAGIIAGTAPNGGTAIGEGSNAVGTSGIAIGKNAKVNTWQGIAVGADTSVTGENSVAVGAGANVSATSGTAVGAFSSAVSQASAFGASAKASGSQSVAVGNSAQADSEYSVAIGSNAKADYEGNGGAGNVAIGHNASATGKYSVAIGQWSSADEDYTFSVGRDWLQRRITNVADGKDAHDAATVGQLDAITDGLKNAGILTNAGTTNTQIGQNASIANTSQALAIGSGAKISYANNFGQSGDIAFGSNAQVTYSTEWDKDGTDSNGKTNAYLHGHSMAMGQNSLSQDSDFSVALGTQAKVTGSNYGTAIGMGSTVSDANYGTAIGSGATIEGNAITKDQDNKSVAIGAGAHVYSDEESFAHSDIVVGSAYVKNSYQSIAIGNSSHVDTGYNNVALGVGASVYSVNSTPVSNAVAIGANSEATESDTVSLGYYINDTIKLNRRITHVADGINASDAATVGQLNTAKTGFEDKVNQVNANIGTEVTKQVSALADKLTASGQGEAANTTTLASMKTAGIVAGSKTGSVNGSIAMGSTGTSITTAAKGGIYGAIALGANAKISWSQEAADSVKDQWNPNGQGWGIIAVGDNTSVKDSMYGEAIGFRSNIENSGYAASYGGYTSIVGSFAGTALGNSVQLTDAYAGTAIGVQSKVLGAKNAVALGSLSIAAQDKTISIGRSIDDIKAYNKYVDEYNAKMEELHPGDDNFKYKKVDEKDVMYRRITSVDAGINDHDAVNLGQFNGKTANDGTQTNFIKDAVGKIDWKAVGDKADAINAAVANLKDPAAAKAAAFSLKGASFSMAKAASPTILADEVGTVSDSRKPEPTAGTGTGSVSVDGIETTKDTITLNKENTRITGNATVGGTLNVTGKSTLGETEVNGSLTIKDGDKTMNVADRINENTNAIQQNSNSIDFLSQDVNRLGGEIDSVGALSAALAGMHPLAYDPSEAKYQISAAMGGYDGSYAAALGGFYHVNKDILLSFGVSSILQGQRKTMGNIGATFRIGAGPKEKAPVLAAGSELDILRRLAEMDQKISALEEENKELKEQIAAQEK